MLFHLSSDLETFKQKAIYWANSFEVCAILDSNHYKDRFGKYSMLIAAGHKRMLETASGNAFTKLQHFRKQNKSWLFGGLSYDLKNEIEPLSSDHPDQIQFPDLFFFEPQHLLIIKETTVEIEADAPTEVWEALHRVSIDKTGPISNEADIECRFTREGYIEAVSSLQKEIKKGNVYEANFCIEFFKENQQINPPQFFLHLNKISPAPFASYFKWFDKYLISTSPERFLAKRGTKLISQPIKGTARRYTDPIKDKESAEALLLNEKERQENVMIVDLVRNDLTKSAKKGTVKVDELFGIYSFQQVHQMISTIVCEADESLSLEEMIKNTFPMGSMTGAPKIKAMQLIEQLEKNRRGIYSGAIGYIDPNDDFDFNVVIRSVLYNQANRYISFQAGSAITYYADAGSEYEECLVKISGIKAALKAQP